MLEEQADSRGNPKCDPRVVGVCIVTCDEDGEQHQTWIDIRKVFALSWCEEEVGRKPPRETGNYKLPAVRPPGPCSEPKPMANGEPEAICWWNGSMWVCGDDDNGA